MQVREQVGTVQCTRSVRAGCHQSQCQAGRAQVRHSHPNLAWTTSV